MNMLLLVGSIFAFSQPYSGEKLSRGLIGIPTEEGMYFSWRMTLEDAAGLQFDLYRSSNGGAEVKLNKEPIDRTSDFLDRTVDYTVDNRWTLKATTGEVATWTRLKGEERNPYLSIPICKPEDGEIAGEPFTYTANDCSVGDLDGDGEYEIILKWSPSNSKRPPQRGFTGNTDVYKRQTINKVPVADVIKLDLGSVAENASVYLNGDYIGTVIDSPYQLYIPAEKFKGQDELVV